MTQTLEALLTGELLPALYRCSTRKRATAIIRLAERQGWRAHWLDGRGINDKATFLGRAAAALQFPSYFGHNWDAFEECLSDKLWESETPTLLLFDHAARFAAAEPEDFVTALGILADVAANRQDGLARLAVLVRGAGRATAHLPALEL